MKYDSGTDFSISTSSCQACLVRPSCRSTLSFNPWDLDLIPDVNFSKTNPEFLLTFIQHTPSLEQIFQHAPRATHKVHPYSVGEARQSVLSSGCLGLLELPNIKRISNETLADRTRPIAQFYSIISPAIWAAFSSYLPTRTAACFSPVSITLSILTFRISFTFFCR